MTKDEALKLALEAMEYADACLKKQLTMKYKHEYAQDLLLEAGTAIKEALAQPEQKPVAYDKTEMNCFVQDLYDKKMQEGKHGHYETMFHVVHQAIKRIPPQRTWIGLTLDERIELAQDVDWAVGAYCEYAEKIEAKLKAKNVL